MHKKPLSRQRPGERGQTIILVAVSLVSLLAMAVLAIDVVNLYVASSEIQRAADAAALAGAKAIADSGITTLLLTDPNFATIQGWVVPSAMTPQIDAVRQNNLVVGFPPFVSAATVDWTRQGNPHITVKLQSRNLPSFFSKIWGGGANFVTASATAEAYNPANSIIITPIAPRSVKPWLVANADPLTGLQFVNTTNATWVVDSGAIGKTFDLVSDCAGSILPCGLNHNPPKALTGTQVEYVPAQVTPNTASICPNSVGACNSSCLGASSYELSIECADAAPYTYVNCGGGNANTTWDNTVNPGGASGASANGAECLIHATDVGAGSQQDTLNPNLWPGAPMQITGGTCSANPSTLVANSSSTVSIPIIDTTAGIPPAGGSVTVVGFLQAFINQVDPAPSGLGQPPIGSINVTVLNIAGCSATNNSANPVVGFGSSPVPVRLITPP